MVAATNIKIRISIRKTQEDTMITTRTGISITLVITQIIMPVMKELVDTLVVRAKINQEKAAAIIITIRVETNTIKIIMKVAGTKVRKIIKEANGEIRWIIIKEVATAITTTTTGTITTIIIHIIRVAMIWITIIKALGISRAAIIIIKWAIPT